MGVERDPLDDFLGSISDGVPVDWDALLRGAAPPERPRVQAMYEISRLASFNRGLQRTASATAVAVGGTAGTELDGSGAGAGDRWGDLLLLERVGAGAQADVFRAWDLKLQREVALKLLRQSARGASAETSDSPLLDEGRAAARIRHPHVVAVHGIDRHSGRVGLWMELVRGTTLEQEVHARGALSAEAACQLGSEIGSAIAAVHAAGLLHRDVKPANIVRDHEGRFVLADFGLGLRFDEAAVRAISPSGTPMFMAPELLAGDPPSPRSDIYSLGLLLWFALAGHNPFEVTTLAALRQAAARGPTPRLRELRPEVPAALEAAITRAIAPTPEARFATAQQWVDALRAVPGAATAASPRAAAAAGAAGARAASAPAARAGSRPRQPLRMAFVALLLLTLVTAGTLSVVSVMRARQASRGGQAATVASSAVASSAVASAEGAQRPAVGTLGGSAAALPAVAAASYSVQASFLRRDAGAATPLLSGDRVRPGDRLSLQVHASCSAWVYVLNEDERGERYLLFPQPLFDRQNPLPKDADLDLPGSIGGRENAWTVTSAGGREYFLVVVSPQPVPELEAELGRLPAPQPGKPVVYAAVQPETVERLRGAGGIEPLPASAAPVSAPPRAFDRFRGLAGRETGVSGVWVRQIVLENPAR